MRGPCVSDTPLLLFGEVFGSKGCKDILEREPQPSRLAQMVERKTLNLVVVGSIPTAGAPPR